MERQREVTPFLSPLRGPGRRRISTRTYSSSFIDIRKRTAGHAEGTEASARSHQAERGCADIATNAVEHHIDTLVDLVFPVSPAVVDDLLSAQFAGDGELALAAGSGDHAGAR